MVPTQRGRGCCRLLLVLFLWLRQSDCGFFAYHVASSLHGNARERETPRRGYAYERGP